jgi:D-serine deaminase-like pyridoxal phosphate-dependent protein
MPLSWDVPRIKAGLEAVGLPGSCTPRLLVDLDHFLSNLSQVRSFLPPRLGLRLSTKSLRVPFLINLSLEAGLATGLLCFSMDEALALLSTTIATNAVVAYPVNDAHRASLAPPGKNITICIDSLSRARMAAEDWRRAGHPGRLNVFLDLDVSYRLGPVVIGAKRSGVSSEGELVEVVEFVLASRELRLVGIMGYEAHVAGLAHESPYDGWVYRLIVSFAKRFLFAPEAARIRARAKRCLEARGLRSGVDFWVNGGGTGCIRSASLDPSLTEVAVGSAAFSPSLFDSFGEDSLADMRQPAMVFTLPVTRNHHGRGFCTVQSGGFIGSGSVGPDKCPVVLLPPSIGPTDEEGFGEVQTPLVARKRGARLPEVGEFVVCRAAKAGEICERFNEVVVLSEKGAQVHKTYRGLGWAFF